MVVIMGTLQLTFPITIQDSVNVQWELYLGSCNPVALRLTVISLPVQLIYYMVSKYYNISPLI